MLGYVTVNRNVLSEEDLRVYRGYYCGVCKSMSRYGQFPRFALSYDSAFLAIVLGSLDDKPEEIMDEHCIIHHIKKNPAVKNSSAVDYAADMLLILAYYNLLDDKNDEHKLRGFAGELALRRAYQKLEKKYPKVCKDIKESLSELQEIEKNKSGNLDIASSAFGKTLSAVFCGYLEDERENRILAELAENLGRWIYVMDAIDDFDDDIKTNSYNPLIYREEGKDNLEDTLYNHLGRVFMAVDMLDIRKNKGIIDNVILFGLRGRTDSMLNKDESVKSEE